MQEKSWLERNRNIIMGFAVVVLVLNIALFLIVPSQTTVSYAGTYPVYGSDTDADLVLSGEIMKTPFSDAVFTGTVSVSGFAALSSPVSLTLTRTDGAWEGQSAEGKETSLLCIAAGKDFADPVIVLSEKAEGSGSLSCTFDASDVLYLAPTAASPRAAEVLYASYFGG